MTNIFQNMKKKYEVQEEAGKDEYDKALRICKSWILIYYITGQEINMIDGNEYECNRIVNKVSKLLPHINTQYYMLYRIVWIK